MAMFLDYKLTRELGKWFLHRDITGDRCGLGWVFFSDLFINLVKQFIRQFRVKTFQYFILLHGRVSIV